MDESVLVLITRILLFTFVTGLLTFVLLYYFRSDWQRTQPGKYIFYFMSSLAVIFLYLAVGPFMIHIHARYYINVILVLLLNFGAWRMTYLLFKIQQGERSSKDHE